MDSFIYLNGESRSIFNLFELWRLIFFTIRVILWLNDYRRGICDILYKVIKDKPKGLPGKVNAYDQRQ